jgi:tetratricopeptide (TPR) repeat protein
VLFRFAVISVRKQLERRRRPPFPNGYTAEEAARLLDLPVGRVYDYVRAEFLEPRRGPRGEYRFTFQELVLLRTAKELSQRLSPRKVKRALANLRQQLPRGRDLAGVRISADGENVLVRDGDSTWIPESGQTLLDFHVAELATSVAPLAQRAAQVAQARDAYGRAVKLNPRHVDAHVNMGRLQHEAGQLRAAESHYRSALQIEPEDATAAYNLGVLLEDAGRPQEALQAYLQAIGADPEYADAHFNVAHLYEERGQKQETVRHLQIYRRLESS